MAVIGPDAKTIIPNTKVVFVAVDNLDEAHYVAGVLNSSIVQLVVTSYTIETGISSHVLKNVFVPKFEPSNTLHERVAALSNSAHALAKQYYEKNDSDAGAKLEETEKRLDVTVAELYGITEFELDHIKQTLLVLREGTTTESTEDSALEGPPYEVKQEASSAYSDHITVYKGRKIVLNLVRNLDKPNLYYSAYWSSNAKCSEYWKATTKLFDTTKATAVVYLASDGVNKEIDLSR